MWAADVGSQRQITGVLVKRQLVRSWILTSSQPHRFSTSGREERQRERDWETDRERSGGIYVTCICSHAARNTWVAYAYSYRVTVGDSGVSCVCVRSFERWLTPLCVDSLLFIVRHGYSLGERCFLGRVGVAHAEVIYISFAHVFITYQRLAALMFCIFCPYW